ncbi:MAG: DUF3050 domain-containing protein [Bacteroidota bacterium]
MSSQSSPSIHSMQGLIEAVAPYRQTLLDHPLYRSMQSIEHVRVFMAHHVHAVWDFMSLVKGLQLRLTGMQMPWKPVGDPEVRYLINEIVLGEESDEDPEGGRIAHFELYLRAMRELGLQTEAIERYVRDYRWNMDQGEQTGLPEGGLAFNRRTFDLIRRAGTHELAAVFTLGREDLIPDMFVRMVETMNREFPGKLSSFVYYLERHIEVDGEHHKHLAYRMTEWACGADPVLWQEAAEAVKDALQARCALWDAVVEAGAMQVLEEAL